MRHICLHFIRVPDESLRFPRGVLWLPLHISASHLSISPPWQPRHWKPGPKMSSWLMKAKRLASRSLKLWGIAGSMAEVKKHLEVQGFAGLKKSGKFCPGLMFGHHMFWISLYWCTVELYPEVHSCRVVLADKDCGCRDTLHLQHKFQKNFTKLFVQFF